MAAGQGVNGPVGRDGRRDVQPHALEPARHRRRHRIRARRPGQLTAAEYAQAQVGRFRRRGIQPRVADHRDRVVWCPLYQPRIHRVHPVEVSIILNLENVVVNVPCAVSGQGADGERVGAQRPVRVEEL